MEVVSTLGRMEMPRMNVSGSPPIFAGRVREEEMDFPARITISTPAFKEAGNPSREAWAVSWEPVSPREGHPVYTQQLL